MDDVTFTNIGQTLTLSEAIAPTQAIYRTYGNTATRYMSSEVYKEANIGGSDYIVYVEFKNGETGFDNIGYFSGPQDGVSVTVKDQHTLTFDILTNTDSSNYSQNNFVVVIKSVQEPNVKYSIDLNVDTERSNQVVINN